ncbi:F0F1 ATP synthase subunit A [Alphaproteobacteria bacterium]|nr:F0F1 ATP synthase subunit A [Alphaproteobacteria bacterium]
MASPTHQFIIQPTDIRFELAGMDLSVTNSTIWMAIGFIVAVTFLLIASKPKNLVPSRMQAAGEFLYEFVAKMVHESIGPKGRIYFPFIFTIFVFVLMGNVLGLIPYSFTYTSHLAVTGGLALMVFFAVFIFGFYYHGFKFLSLFVPSGAPMWLFPLIIPIEIISFFVRPFTLSVRLFANMMAGHIMLKIVAGFAIAAASMGGAGVILGVFPVAVNVGLMLFELLIALIQAYVFAILSCVYLKDTVDLHH